MSTDKEIETIIDETVNWATQNYDRDYGLYPSNAKNRIKSLINQAVIEELEAALVAEQRVHYLNKRISEIKERNESTS